MSKRHNITYIKWSSELKFNNFAYDISKELDPLWYEGMYLQFYSGKTHHYCVDTKLRNTTAQLGYDTFIKPMPISSWILLIINWLIISIIRNSVSKDVKTLITVKHFIFELLNTFYLICCTGINFRQNMRSLIIISFGCFLFWSIYQNNIIGLTIVGEKFKPFSTVDEFLNAGYLFSDGWGDKCKEPNEVDAEKYFCVNGKQLTDYDYRMVVLKLGWQRISRWNLWFMHEYTRHYRKAYGPSLECHFIKQEEKEAKPYFTTIYTNNLFWMTQTLKSTYEGGFILKWNDWATLAQNIHKNQISGRPDKIPDSIKLKQFLSVVFAGLILHFVASVVLVVEIITWFVKWCKQARVLLVIKVKFFTRRLVYWFFTSVQEVFHKIFKLKVLTFRSPFIVRIVHVS